MSDNLETPFAEPQTEDKARDIIDQISFQHGIFSARDEIELSKTSPEYQRKSKLQASQNRKTLAAVTKLAATQLYTSRFRFIYELIQNADDSRYSRCISKGYVPLIKFTLRPPLIIIESNEDGFTVRDIQAICNTAQSSKQGNNSTIGAKGLGFKSVFAISNRVTIQSGLWSFAFESQKGDDGLGMITPHWTMPVAMPANVGTRITLHLNRKDDGFLKELSNAFADVPDSTLLFLRQLATLSISDEQTERSTISRVFARHDKWNAAEKSTYVNINGTTTHLLYKMHQGEFPVASSGATDGENSNELQRTTVELAFPVQQNSGLPSVSDRGQHIFAFLPMKRMAHLPFIIQADFDTAASREAVTDEVKNRQLRSAIAELFSEAIETFCKDNGDLRYSWMQYVPGDQLDDFWITLRPSILSNLENKSLLIAEGDDKLHPIASLRVVPSVFQHQGEPLLHSETYLSSQYDEDAVKILMNLGLPTLKKYEMLDLIQKDLKRGFEPSIIHSTDLQNSWHTTFVDFLLERICPAPILKRKLCDLPVVPLSCDSGIKWHRPSFLTGSTKIYFPRVDNHDLSPTLYPDLGLLLVHPEAYSLPERRGFYQNLGIGHAEQALIDKLVLAKNAKCNSGKVRHFIAHLAILFWHGTSAKSKLPSLWGIDRQNRIVAATRLYMYSSEPYSASKLLEDNIDHSAFGFISKFYLEESVKDHVRNDGETWKSWLMNTAGVRIYPCLTESDPEWKGLSPVFREVAAKAPSKVVGTLEANWKEYKAQVGQFPEVLSDLKNVMVLCRNGEKRKLCQTILPTKETVDAGNHFGVAECLPYLQMDCDSDCVTMEDWSFLQTFDVCLKPTLRFHLDALEHLSKAFGVSTQSREHALKLYLGIISVATLSEKEMLRQFFCSHLAIYTSKAWRNISQCVWSGPDFDIAKVVLAKEYANYDWAQNLFANLLEIEDATHDDILQELERLSKVGLPASLEIAQVLDIYKELELKVEWTSMTKDIRKLFETKALIYTGLTWQKLSSSVWSSAVQLRGKTVLSNIYPDMSGFFKDRLGAKVMNTAMLLEEIIRVCDNKTTDKDEVKSLLREITSMLSNEDPTDKVDELLRKLRDTKFLPLRYRTVAVDSHDTAFATPKEPFYIDDDQRFADAFTDKVSLLDFSTAEMNTFRPMFAALRLENRYISRRVQVETSVEGQKDVSEALTADFRLRCFAISCCVLSHKSPREYAEYNHMHQRLLLSEVCTSSNMLTTFSLDELTCEVTSDTVSVRIDVADDRIRIVIPKDENDQRRCYRAHLPMQLLKFLGIYTQAAEKPMYRILNEPLSTLDDLLADEGITTEEQLERRDQSVERALVERLETVHLHQPSNHLATLNGCVDSDDSSYVYHHPVGPAEIVDEYSPERFKRVLEHVVRQAQAVGNNQQNGLNDNSNHAPVSRGDIGSTLVTAGSWQRIGVAGELFVFERLRALGVTDLDTTSWRSNMRHLVRDLPQYQHISQYHSAEISDIMYTDVSGDMERIIRCHKALNRPTWPDSDRPHEPIEFYIEVKTTINSCDDRFWVSKHQYELLTEHALSRGQRPKIVYIIARVFDLLSPRIDVKFFVDPKSLEGGVLHFEWEKCAVTSNTSYF